MKLAVYTISLNEEKFLDRWYESAKSADFLLIADTGSTDNTVRRAKALGINVLEISVKPWRFDDARNASLAALPKDIDMCIQLDMDEVLVGNWRKDIERLWKKGNNRITYRYVSSWKEGKTGEEADIEFDGFKCHSRIGYRWKYPVHEVVCPYKIPEIKAHSTKFEIHHYPDNTKSRESYLTMLEDAVEEDPIPRHLYYLGREYYYKNRDKESAEYLKRYIKVSEFPAEKASALRVLAKVEPNNAEEWLTQATEAYPSRESILALANYYYDKKMWVECLVVGEKALSVTHREKGFLSEAWAWGYMGYDITALAAWSLEEYDVAYALGKKALELDPTNERLQNNLKFYQEKVNEHTK